MEREPAVDGAAEQESPGAAQVKQGLGQLTLETPGAKGARRDAKNPRAKNKGKRQQQQPEERGRLSLSDPGNLRCAPPLAPCPALSGRSPAAAGSSRIPVASGPSSPSSSVWVPRDRAGSDPRREPLLPEGLRAQHASHRCRRPGARGGSESGSSPSASGVRRSPCSPSSTLSEGSFPSSRRSSESHLTSPSLTPRQKNKERPKYEAYMPLCEVQQALKKGQVVEGVLRINPRNYEDSFISAPVILGSPVLLAPSPLPPPPPPVASRACPCQRGRGSATFSAKDGNRHAVD